MATRVETLYVVYIILLLCRNNVFAVEPVNYKINDTILICSRWLGRTLANVCDNDYKIVKRDTSILMEKMAPKSVQEQKTKQRLLEKERWRRFRRQIVSECCDNPCTVGEILSYCPNDSKVVRENPQLFEN
ncbi:bombyxin A-2 homolog [Amyelois transitella]|uniref:bombyxin A-2 homolog n=1 Tax=Amyelois transitella TaxID=680683 RepID=UPI00299027F3|nr:bombyxin A-2 homolog [Amyelois transitella]